MAQAILEETKLRLIFETGVNEKGEPVFKTKTFNNVKKEATADQLLKAAQALGSLCNDPLSSIGRNDTLDIIG
ncbi:DUF1659 domain-containing protein [Neobacillus sp. PS3-34]|uniref:DUF1659 domain-containing protein n=1 Tax=Neobacillus sp. PS3-34 TaxID=3070678 RepID=UPI0027E0DD2C|nr:DUF1659 domain-containing protein [Neobacillus sp. PS3-34]WML48915.1 DUF1659 domain-containing protein [Neobacillus sp. PS3-34]